MSEISNPFFLATSQRSGGHFLMSLLDSTKKVGYVTEYLYQLYEGWEGDSPPSDAEILSYFDRFKKKALEFYPQFNPMEFWGSKVDIRELHLVERWTELTSVDLQSVKWIWLRRKNKLRQAISVIKADKTTIWHLDKDDPQGKQDLARAEMEVKFDDLCVSSIRFFVADWAWLNFFRIHDLKPHILYYEDFVDESTWELTVAGIFDFLGVPYEPPLGVSSHRLKQGTGKAPENYNLLVEKVESYGIPLKYADIDIDRYYELDLETFE